MPVVGRSIPSVGALEAAALLAAGDGGRAVLVQGEVGDHGDVGVHRVADGNALFRLDDAVVDVGPHLGLARIDEGEGQGAERVALGELPHPGE